MGMMKHAASLAALCATVTVATADEPPSVTLSLTRPADTTQARQVYRRIEGAARQVCAPLESRELSRQRAYKGCVNEAVARAVAQVGSGPLTQLHLAAVGAAHPRL